MCENMNFLVKCRKVLRQCRQITIEPVVFLFQIGFSMTLPVVTNLTYRKSCMDKYNDWTMCKNLHDETRYKTEREYTQNKSADWVLYQALAQVIPAFFVAFALGSRSDKHGRKTSMLLPTFGQVIYLLFFLVLSVYLTEVPIIITVIASVVSGLTGGITVMYLGAFAFLADITSREKMTTRISIVEAFSNFGQLLGPVLSGLTIDSTDLWVPIFILMVIYSLNTFYILLRIPRKGGKDDVLVMPEGSPGEFTPADQRPACEGSPARSVGQRLLRVSGISNMIDTFVNLFKPREGNRRMYLLLLLTAFFSALLSMFGANSIMFIFASGNPLYLSASTFSYFSAVKSASAAICLFAGLPLVKIFFHTSDMVLLIFGCITAMGAAAFTAVSTHTWMIFAAGVAYMGTGFIFTPVRGSTSTLVPMNEQGRTMAVIAALESIGYVVATAIYTRIYKAVLPTWPGLTFIIGGSPLFICLAIAIYLRTKLPAASEQDNKTIQEVE